MKQYIKGKRDALLDSVLTAEEQMSGLHSTQKRRDKDGDTPFVSKELMQKIAGSLINASIERMRSPGSGVVPSGDPLAAAELARYLEQAQIDSGKAALNKVGIQEEPFIALFLDKLISRLVPEKLPEREHLQLTDFEDGDGQRTSPINTISVTTLASNITQLSERMESVFELQDSVVRVLSWKRPATMVVALLVFTKVCYNPMYMALFPLLYLVFGICLPQYNRKHAEGRRFGHTSGKIGRSLFNDLLTNRSQSKVPTQNYGYIGESPTLSNEGNSEPSDITHGMKVVMNLRDFQNLTTSQLKAVDAASKFVNETAAFTDERQTTWLVLLSLITFVMLRSLAPIINWSFFFSATAWIGAIAIHPRVNPRIKSLFKKKSIFPEEEIDTTTLLQNHHDIVLDQPPQSAEVEIFEIFREGLVPTTWKFFLFSTSLFDLNDESRRAQKPPPGVKSLSEVEPPEGWIFDKNSEWEVDYRAATWVGNRNLDLQIDGEFMIDTAFKRRRLTRRVLRDDINTK